MDDQQNNPRFKFTPISLVYLFLFAVFVYLIVYHGPHLWTILPLFIIFLCPLMHMHHHGHTEHKDSEVERKREEMRKDLVPDHENLCHFDCVKAPGLRFPQVGPMLSNMDPLVGTQPRELSRSQNGKDFRGRVLEKKDNDKHKGCH